MPRCRKPEGDNGASSARLIARDALDAQKALAAEIAGLKRRLDGRQTVVRAVTLLTARGKPRAMLGPCAGGRVTLAEAPGRLVVAEGIETALSLACGLLRGPATIWAGLSAPGVAALNLPPVPGRLTIATDGDEAGKAAGLKLAERAKAAGWTVGLLPAPKGRDWNDVLTARRDR